MSNKPRLFLLDAYALIFRAYYAFINRPMINSKGLNTSAIYGFTTSLTEVLKKEKPEYIGVAFDPPSKTFRHQMFSEYKSNRMATPEEIKKAVPYIKRILNAFNIPVIEVEGFEADDVVGTLSKRAEKEGLSIYMMTPDKDYMQLVSENIFVYKPSRSGGEPEIIGVEEVKKIFQVDEPVQVIDVLGLWGDSADNIPGASGIGEKTAKDLISKYKSIENLIEHINELKGKQKEKIENSIEQIKLSHELAKICLDVPVDLDLEKLKMHPWNNQELKNLFTELEFRTLAARILSNSSGKPIQQDLFNQEESASQILNVSDFKTIHNTKHNYILIKEDKEVIELAEKLKNLKEFCFDTETTGLNTRNAEIVGLSISFNPSEAYYITFPKVFNEAKRLLFILKSVFNDNKIKKIGQNIKYDLQILNNYDIEVNGEVFDTMIAHYLIQPELRHNMDYMSEVYLNYKPVSIEELIGEKGKSQKNMKDVDEDLIKEYAGEDADITYQLYNILNKQIESKGLSNLAYNVEMPLIKVLADLENAGFRINTEDLNSYSKTLKNELVIVEKEIYNLAGIEFKIGSPKQLGEILFERLKITENAQKTKTNQYSTGEDILIKLKDNHPIISKILDYRAIQKLINTYVDALPELIDPRTNKIHTSFDQAWVATGRLSSKNPNLQNIPIREERGREIRKAFIASGEDYVLLSADYSQIELRLMAHLSYDKNMIEAFSNNEDIHTTTASKIYKVPINEVSREMRSKAKTANFGIIYGISAFGLAQRLNISRGEASELINGYFNTYPDVKEYMNNVIKLAKEKGYVETLMGRRRFLPDIHSANAVVRGVAERMLSMPLFRVLQQI